MVNTARVQSSAERATVAVAGALRSGRYAGSVGFLEVGNDRVVVVEDDVAIDESGNTRLSRSGFRFVAFGVRMRFVHDVVIEQQIGELRGWAQAWSDDLNRRLYAESYDDDLDDEVS